MPIDCRDFEPPNPIHIIVFDYDKHMNPYETEKVVYGLGQLNAACYTLGRKVLRIEYTPTHTV